MVIIENNFINCNGESNPVVSDENQGRRENTVRLQQEMHQQELELEQEQRRNKRKRRWGTTTSGTDAKPEISSTNNATDSTTTSFISNSSIVGVDARARLLALQESVKARLAAARASTAAQQERQGQQNTLSITGGDAVHIVQQQSVDGLKQQHRPKSALFLSSATSTTIPTAKSMIKSPAAFHDVDVYDNSLLSQQNLKKARHYELDLTVTVPSYKDPNIVKSDTTSFSTNTSVATLRIQQQNIPSNPYLAHHQNNVSNANTTENLEDSSRTVLKDKEGANDSAVDPRLMIRASKPRVWNKGFSFIEPGTWQERATKIRASQAKIMESGYLSGRKKGHTVQGATMMYYGSGGGGSGIDYDTKYDFQHELPARADANPKNIHQNLPSIAEWWDLDLLPSKLRKQVAALEQEKDDTSKSKLVPLRVAKKKQREDDQYILMNDIGDENDVNDKDCAKLKQTSSNELNDLESNGVDDDDDINMYYTPRVKELRLLCYKQASLANSKTAELVQHIVPIRPKVMIPNTGTDASIASIVQDQQPGIVLHLTKKELKRQRKLRRQEKQRELQDLQAAGLIQAPEPRLTLQNFFQVLGDAAVTDPSQIEMIVQNQIQVRQQQHLERNEAKKLSKEQRSLKKQQQLIARDNAAALSQQITVALFLVHDISHPYHRTKIDLNAQQLNLTGGVIECKQIDDDLPHSIAPINGVIVEGNPRSITKFTRLMTVRMKWTGPDDGDDDEDDAGQNIATETMPDVDDSVPVTVKKFNPNNSCEFVWKGLSAKRYFNSFLFQECATDSQARKICKSRGIEHYWDQIVQRALTSRQGGNSGNRMTASFKLYTPDSPQDERNHTFKQEEVEVDSDMDDRDEMKT